MRIATFNCNSVRTRLPAILDWLASHAPDVLCLQETKATDDDFPADAFRSAGWHVAFSGEKSYNGVAIVSKTAPLSVETGLDSEPADPARLLLARFPAFSVLDTYVPQGRAIDHPMYAYKLEWFARLLRFVSARFTPADPLLWCGDLNVARHPIDVSSPETKTDHVCYHAAVREAFEEVLAFGFTDLFRAANPALADYSFYDYRSRFDPANRRGWRIDYILATPPLAARPFTAAIDIAPRTRPKPSDHVPLYADLALP